MKRMLIEFGSRNFLVDAYESSDALLQIMSFLEKRKLDNPDYIRRIIIRVVDIDLTKGKVQ